jgi:hypothetical protein
MRQIHPLLKNNIVEGKIPLQTSVQSATVEIQTLKASVRVKITTLEPFATYPG